VISVTLLLVLAIFLFGVFPAISAITFQIQENNNRQDTLTALEQKRVILRNLIAEEKSKRAVTIALQASMPDDLLQAQLFTDIQKLTKNSGAVLTAVAFADLESKRALSTLFTAPLALDGKLMTLNVEGNRADLENLFTVLENSRRIYNIREFNVFKKGSAETAGPNDKILIMDVKAEVYFWNKSKTL
jgi:Tfp pilus assembly protein PilO